jgi:hypothetical protein
MTIPSREDFDRILNGDVLPDAIVARILARHCDVDVLWDDNEVIACLVEHGIRASQVRNLQEVKVMAAKLKRRGLLSACWISIAVTSLAVLPWTTPVNAADGPLISAETTAVVIIVVAIAAILTAMFLPNRRIPLEDEPHQRWDDRP